MEIVHADWEQRNMGVDCIEILLDRKDDLEEVKRVLSEVDAEYTVVKVPTAMAEMAFQVQEAGFRYIECLFSLRRSTDAPALSPMQEKLMGCSECVPMNESDYERLYSEVRNDMFDTGRVFLDPYFTKEQANERYVGWIHDEIDRGTVIYKLLFKGEDAGFFGLKELRKGVLFPFLAGLYPGGPSALGLGYVLCYQEIMQAAHNGARTITGSVSSNNIPSLASLTSYGYTVDGAVSVFVKHLTD